MQSVIGFPYETALVAERMILKGIFERYPNVCLCLAHGGGFLPYNIWRLDHANLQRSDLTKLIPRPSSHYLSSSFILIRFYIVSKLYNIRLIPLAPRESY